MPDWITSYADRRSYRVASIGLIAAVFAMVMANAMVEGPAWLGAVAALPFALVLVVLTFCRMRDAGLSSGWALLMVVTLNFGPSLELPGLTLYLSNAVYLIPLALGWTAPSRAVDSYCRDGLR